MRCVKIEELYNDLWIFGTLSSFHPGLRVLFLVTELQNLVNQWILSPGDETSAMLAICGLLVNEWKISEEKREHDEEKKKLLYLYR